MPTYIDGAASVTATATAALAGVVRRGHIVDASAVGVWRFNEPSGSTIADETGNGHTLTINSTPTYVVGTISQGYRMTAAAQYFSRANNAAFTTAMLGECTVEAWVWLENGYNANGYVMDYAGNGETAATNGLMAVTIGSTRYLGVYWEKNTGTDVINADATAGQITAETWTHIGVVRRLLSPGKYAVDFYVNGALVDTLDNAAAGYDPPTDGSSATLTFGRWPDASSRFKGAIDDARISSVARTATEIANSYRHGSTGTTIDGAASVSCSASATATADLVFGNGPSVYGGSSTPGFTRFRRIKGGDNALVFKLLPDPATELADGALSGYRGETLTTVRAGSSFATASASSLAVIAANAPRVESLGLLCELANTNIAIQSQTFDSASWSKLGSGIAAPVVTANAVVAPDGTLTADQIVFPASTAGSQFSDVRPNPNLTVTAVAHTITVWLRCATGTSTIYLYAEGNPDYVLTACALTTTWQKFSLAVTFAAGTKVVALGQNTYIGSNQPAQTVYAWGFQLQTGTYATTYVPTTTVAVAQTVDIYSVATTSAWPQLRGDISLKFTPRWTTPIDGMLLDTRTDDNNGGYCLYTESGAKITFQTQNPLGSTYTSSSGTTWVAGTTYTIRVVWGAGAVTIYRDGVQIAQTASGAQMPGQIRSTCYIGSTAIGAHAYQPNGHIYDLVVRR